jgi:hypothetical protein
LNPTAAVLRLPRTSVWARDDPWQKLSKELRAAGYFPELAEELRMAEKGAGAPEPEVPPAILPGAQPRTRAANGNGSPANGSVPPNGSTPTNGAKPRTWRKRPASA